MDDTKASSSSAPRKRANGRKTAATAASQDAGPPGARSQGNVAANRLSNVEATRAEPATARRAPSRSRNGNSRPAADDGLRPGGPPPLQQLLAALRAVQGGDFSVRLPSGAQDVVMDEIARAFNAVVTLNSTLTHEIVRVERVVGREGRMGERVNLGDVRGDWATSVQSINALIGDLVQPTTEVARVLVAVAEGDLTQKMALEIDGQPVKGEFLRIGTTVNAMVDQLNSFAAEVTRVAKEVGTEGKLGGQADVKGVSGVWKDLTDNVNVLAGNLTAQVRNIAEVTTAVARGDLSRKITVDVKGEVLELKSTINTMVDQLNSFASEVTRVAREVGTEGKLGGQAAVSGVSGTWKDLTDNVNFMASNLTTQVRGIVKVVTAVANGDLTQKLMVPSQGEIAALGATLNNMTDTLNVFAQQVTSVARTVGVEGKLGAQAQVPGAAGTWKDLTDNVNLMASNLTSQVRNIAEVSTAVANGDLSRKITVDVKGEVLELKSTINTMVDQLRAFAAEVTRVAKEVGTDGKLGGQAAVPGVGGTWKDLTDNVNSMASNLTTQVRNIALVTTAVATGDLSKKITVDARGEILELKNTINTMVDQLNSFASEVTRVAREVGTHGKLGGQAEVKGVSGTWKDLTDNVNFMASNLTTQVRGIAKVVTAVANGDLTQRLKMEAKGEVAELADTINAMTQTLSIFAQQVTDVARTVGVEGKLGAQAVVPGVAGTWKDLTNNVNLLANNLTDQVRNIAEVTTAVAKGDLSRKITVDAKGEVLELKSTINTMVDQLRAFASEVTRVAKEVGTDGKLGGQADVKGVSGVWKDLTDNVNSMAFNLTTQVRGIVKVVTAVADGDLSQKLVMEAKGEIAALADTINAMTQTLSVFAQQVTDVARTVGVEGKLGAQAEVPGVAGTWKDLTNNVNLLANNLTAQVRNIAEVTTAVANGDLSKKITVDAKGEVLELKSTINTMVDQLRAFAAEVTRVAKEVGTEGKLGGQADVKGVSGVWKDLTDNVNVLAGNLTDQVRNIAKVTTAVANGDLSQKITVSVKGEVLELKNTINTMVDQLRAFASEVTRVGKEVGTEGKLGGQAAVPGVAGVWKDLTDNVNVLAANLTDQVRNIAKVTTAVAYGDLSQKISVEARGEILELKSTINTMVDQLRAFASEVTRVAKEVGTDGKLGGQAAVPGVAGTWKDLTDNVNSMASNLTSQVRNIALVTTAVANGDLSKKITVDAKGEILELKNTINTMVDQLNSFASEVTRVAREVGAEGKLGGQAEVKGVSGTWKDLTDNVNFMARNLTTQVRGIVKVVTAVANGDLKQKLVVDAKGEVAALAETINNMTDTLGIFAEQVSSVAREVGVEGKLGGQARVPGVAGTWKDLTDNVNFMASNLTTQVRGIVRVVTAVANGDLTQKLIVDAKGEVAALADTINNMTDTLGTFAEQVSTVAREVGIEGKLGGQARVPGARGTWRQLTDNVNQLAGTLTSQLRAISDVATAVTKGDLTRSITVVAEGEVAALKDNINQMIVNLRETTQKNQEQDWLKTNLAKFSGMMQGQKSLDAVSRLIMSELTPLVSAHHGAFFLSDPEGGMPSLKLTSTYAYRERKHLANRFRLGEGLVGQCALEKKTILLTRVPSDYITISSGLGESAPLNIIVLPVLFEGEVKAVIELASFHPFSAIHQIFLDQLTESIGVVLNMIMANMRTETLLSESQRLTQELQSQSRELTQQQDELKRTNIELEDKAKELADQNTRVEEKNREVELARVSLEEKAEQLTIISKYKSEFLANMSHELRTPLNSLLILAKLLSDNKDGNLSNKQVEYANTIYASGGDLLSLINEILDLSKVEAGKMQVEPRDIVLTELNQFIDRSFRPVADQKGLTFQVEVLTGTPRHVRTDPQRLQQVLKNLLSNAFKFTDEGGVKLTVRLADKGIRFDHEALRRSRHVLAFAVKDTGIGIAKDKQRIIFEAFQQADGSTARKYGGTGLGLSISREIAKLLGGEIRLESEPGKGSTFTLYLPPEYQGADEEGGQGNDEASRALGALPETHAPPSTSGIVTATTPLAPPSPVAEPQAHVLDAALPPQVEGSHTPVVVEDDRELIREGDRTLLIIEDDLKFARIMVQMAREKGFKALVATRGDSGLSMAHEYQPDAITLDIQLPVVDGWSVLDRLKRNPRTRHIPVHIISVMDKHLGNTQGAFGYLTKPVSKEGLERVFGQLSRFLERRERRLLVIEDDDVQRNSLTQLLSDGGDVVVTAVASGQEALAKLEENEYDCLVIDLLLPDMDGIKLVEEVKTQQRFRDLPIVVYTGRELTPKDEARLRRYTGSVILKSGAKSPDQLLSDTALFLHRLDENLPARARAALAQRNDQDAPLAGKKVLLVDDDMRNIFALTSVLENHSMQVVFAENGRAAIEMLGQHPDVDVVLMDVMMPEMDGYETMRAIRKDPKYASLPIIAVTAKALKDDREKCMAAGASDYLPKPVDTDKLLELVRLWVSA
ncbi:HAMP domain-containing protein [Corallococcus exiguus]|uniref:HAMP domain-containing protein n=1 Tax=Corallococcus TaxID=83461 RepID=UPI000EA31EA3|nr:MULTISPECIES: HAMP domain-containing protein [unclassified Corallococcus]NRD62900.1 HAMP domain-containing protein [Corallococcus exiguus]RKH22855.1 HAMP domain-containing protein [Corallococcus sp. CA041A]RKI12975.1 HAMP domain-containing protein [Corallococcus sp. AB030]